MGKFKTSMSRNGNGMGLNWIIDPRSVSSLNGWYGTVREGQITWAGLSRLGYVAGETDPLK